MPVLSNLILTRPWHPLIGNQIKMIKPMMKTIKLLAAVAKALGANVTVLLQSLYLKNR
jgi:hypothetical protein